MARETIYDDAMVRIGGTVRPEQKAFVDRRWRQLGLTGRSEYLRLLIDEAMREEGEDES